MNKNMNKLELMNQWASKLSVEQIKDLSEDEILSMVIERPGHPGSFGFMLALPNFKTLEHMARISTALVQRLGKVENMKEKMLVLRQK